MQETGPLSHQGKKGVVCLEAPDVIPPVLGMPFSPLLGSPTMSGRVEAESLCR